MDLEGIIRSVETQDPSPLAAGADHAAAVIAARVTLKYHQGYFLLDLVDELDHPEILIPAQDKDPRGEKGFDPRM
jgi:hypothetical protein